MNEFRHIGLLGLGKFSTNYYQNQIQERWEKEMGKDTPCPLVVHSVDFASINEHLPYGFDILIPLVKKHLTDLADLDVRSIVIPNITLHLTVDKAGLPKSIADKIAHPIELLINHLKSKNIDRVTLLGTRHTMDSPFIKEYFDVAGIQLEIVDAIDMEQIDQLRLAVFENGASRKATKVLSQISGKYIHPVLICTELSLINSDCIDVVSLQLDKAMFLNAK